MNRVERTVTRGDEAIVLTNKEFALLEYLLLHRGRAVSRATLLENVWNMSPDANTNVVDVYINYLRRKLHDRGAQSGADAAAEEAGNGCAHPAMIRTVRGLGYSIDLRG